jgi:hypothetical protein
MTWDRGHELWPGHQRFTLATDIRVASADPAAPGSLVMNAIGYWAIIFQRYGLVGTLSGKTQCSGAAAE